MKKLAVLVTTMHGGINDFSLYEKMGLTTDAVIANQADDNAENKKEINGHTVTLVTTDTRGLSKNRNIALSYAEEYDYIVFSDDDLVFYEGLEQRVTEDFTKHPEADAIKYNIRSLGKREISAKPVTVFHKSARREVTSVGVCALAIRMDAVKDNNLYFNERFGTGTENFCGEDTIFLQNLFAKKLNLYLSPEYVADIFQNETTWCHDFNENRFIVSGKLIHEAYPLLSPLLALRSAYKFSKRTDYSFLTVYKCYLKGIKKNKKERKAQ